MTLARKVQRWHQSALRLGNTHREGYEYITEKFIAHFLALLPKEDELNNMIYEIDKANGGNGAPCTEISEQFLANIKERIEKEMG